MAIYAEDIIADRDREIERQHSEIIELIGRLTDALRLVETLEIEKDNLASELIKANRGKGHRRTLR